MIVKFLVRKTGAVVEKKFTSYWHAMNFVRKARKSKKIMLLSYGEEW